MADAPIQQYIQQVPAPFRPELLQYWDAFAEQCSLQGLTTPSEPEFLESLCKVWTCSRFVAQTCRRYPRLLLGLLESGDLHSNSIRSTYSLRFDQREIDSEATLLRLLREFRREAMVRIAWRDIAGWSALDETLADLSAMAETSVQKALDYLFAQACEKRGTPLLDNGGPQNLVILGMGKLGAWELNFSSDIDLIFAYPEEGELQDRRGTTYNEFFVRLGRSLINALDKVTADGSMFRVDMRLRPFGNSGPLVMSFRAMERYYHEQGREWERYAMVKARPIAGDLAAGSRLQDLLRPFVYRPYLDFGIFVELRDLKSQISRQLQRKKGGDNVKQGVGGIREVEFITQAFQLIRGGRDSQLQERRVLPVLKMLAERTLLPQRAVDKLIQGYRHLRIVENRLQEFSDQQTNDLPSQPDQQLRLAYSLGFDDWQGFKSHLDRLRQQIHEIFEEVFQSPQLQEQEQEAEKIWSDSEQTDLCLRLLDAIGYGTPETALEGIRVFRTSHVVNSLGEKSAATLALLMPMVLNAAGQRDNPELVLQRLIDFFEVVARRGAYLSLLLENPLALTQLVNLASASPWIVGHISRDPLMLDELLNPNKLYEPLMRSDLARALAERVADIDRLDLEQQLIELRYFKQSYVLRVAAADITNAIPLIVVSDYLTDIAEVVLESALILAWRHMASKHGVPQDADPDTISGFGIAALGRSGSRELSYDSYLELIYLYDVPSSESTTGGATPISTGEFYRHLAKRVNLLLTTRMPSGLLYDTSTPGSGTERIDAVISSVDAYRTHLESNESAYERGAMVQARYLVGDEALGKTFQDLRTNVLHQVADAESVRKDCRGMRAIDASRVASMQSNVFDIRYGRGGLGEIETLIRLGVLTNVHQDDKLDSYIESMSLLNALRNIGFFSNSEHSVLQEAYLRFRETIHVMDLQESPAVVAANRFSGLQSRVADICDAKLGV